MKYCHLDSLKIREIQNDSFKTENHDLLEFNKNHSHGISDKTNNLI